MQPITHNPVINPHDSRTQQADIQPLAARIAALTVEDASFIAPSQEPDSPSLGVQFLYEQWRKSILLSDGTSDESNVEW